MMMTAKPYKKRLLSSLNSHITNMEVENSDGTERNHTTSPSSQEECEKDSTKEPSRHKRGWKKKVCRKQFRHYDIEIFKPGTNPTTCLLKKKDTSPTIVKTFEPPPLKESITDLIVNSLGGQKSPPHNYLGASSLVKSIEIAKSTSSTQDLAVEWAQCFTKFRESKIFEEKDDRILKNTETTMGKHNLPAIVNETPVPRRKSMDVGHETRISWSNQVNSSGKTRRLSIDMPLLDESKQVESKTEINCNRVDNIVTNIISKTLEYQEVKASASRNNVKVNVTEHMEWAPSKIHHNTSVLETKNQNLNNTKTIIKDTKTVEHRIDCDPEDLSCHKTNEKRVTDVPVDLSIKTGKDSIESIKTVNNNIKQSYLRQTYYHFLESTPKRSTYPYINKSVEAPTSRDVSQCLNTTNFTKHEDESSFHPKNFANSFRKLEEEILYHATKITNIVQKDFTTNNLRRLCQSYQQLSIIHRTCHTLPLESRAYIENILNETYRYISSKIRHVNLQPLRVLNTLGTLDMTQEKVELMNYLNKVFHRAASITNKTISDNIQQNQKFVKSPLTSPKERSKKVGYQKKIEELKQHLPPYNTLPPNLINSVTTVKHLNGAPSKLEITKPPPNLSNWRRCPEELLTPSPTAEVRVPPIQYEEDFQKRLTNIDHSLAWGHDRILQSPNGVNILPNMNDLALNELTVRKDVTSEIPKKQKPNERHYLDEKNKVKTIRLGSVIVADHSMQITKEPVNNLSKNGSESPKNIKEKFTDKPQKMDIDADLPASRDKNNTEIEFLNIIQKLKSEYPEEKMTQLLLSQLNSTSKKRKIVVENVEPIEITDSDSEDSRKDVFKRDDRPVLRQTKSVRKVKAPTEKRRVENLEITTKTQLDIETKIRLENRASQDFTPTSVQCTVQKTIYSPEIEPISPVEDEVFQFPEVPKIDNITKENTSSVISKNDFPKIKRQKSEDYDARVAPHGKLCYIREQNIFLRYFDESQTKLFIKNSVLKGDESVEDRSILSKDTPPSEKIQIPPQVEFSHKEDIPEPIEFVHELRLVEQYVPKDFAAFYRYVTGYQIVRNKNPVSLQTFLLMYNTNGISELLKKYLNPTEGDQMVPM